MNEILQFAGESENNLFAVVIIVGCICSTIVVVVKSICNIFRRK